MTVCAEARETSSKSVPIARQRFALHVTMGQSTHEKLEYARALLSHQIPSGDVTEVLDRALDALIKCLEKRKFAATGKPRLKSEGTGASVRTRSRHIPAHVKRHVWKRDGGQCTFASETGKRCPSRKFLEFDHALEVARGGEATPDGIRLRCRAHNQFTAACTFGKEFMSNKRRARVRRENSRTTAIH